MEAIAEVPFKTLHIQREALFEALYIQTFPKVARFISNRNGTFDDAQDIFQDALVIWYEKSNEPGVEITASPEAYIIGIARHLWFRRHKQTSKERSLADFDTTLRVQETQVNIHEGKLLNLLEKTGKKCLDLLRSLYYDGRAAKDMSGSPAYVNERAVAVQKYKCLEKIRDVVKQKSISYEAFTD